MTRWIRFAPLAALLLVLAPISSAAAATEERWYVLEMQGQKAGWSVMRQMTVERPGADPLIRTEMEMRVELARGQANMAITIATWFEETMQGEPIAMSSASSMGAMQTTSTFRFQGDTVEITESQGGVERTRATPAPDQAWLTPAEMVDRLERAIDTGAESFSLRTIDPSLGLQPVEMTYQRVGPDQIRVAGKTVPATKWTVRNSAVPGGVSTEWLDEDARPVRSEMRVGALKMNTVASEKELALSPLDPPEIMASTLIPIEAPIAEPRRTTRAEYVLSGLSDEAPVPTAGAQRAKALGDGRYRVIVDLADPAPAPESDVANGAYLADSAMIDPTDPDVRALAFDIDVPAAARPEEIAEALRRRVHQHIDEKSLDVGFASASEVCRTGEGDCSEHAVLLAALLRARGVPSRVASGVIYVDEFLNERQVFGFHMWTQALLEIDGERRWIDLDATLPDDTPTDATHIILDVSSLAPGETVNSMAALAPAIGKMEIEVVDIE